SASARAAARSRPGRSAPSASSRTRSSAGRSCPHDAPPLRAQANERRRRGDRDEHDAGVAGGLAVLLLRERLTWARAGGIAFAVVGILTINVTAPAATPPAGPNTPLGNLLVLGAVV